MAADAEDRISALPDDLIQAILAWLPTAAAARTSVLSRRWRVLWTCVPALSFHVERYKPPGASSSTADDVDAALDAYSASAGLKRLALDVHHSTPAPRVARWLHFASLRLAGELRLSLPGGGAADAQEIWMFTLTPVETTNTHQLIELPVCERATRVELATPNFNLRLPAAGAFASLRALRIDRVVVLHGDVGHFVSTQCPRLRELEMSNVSVVAADDISIRSATLERLVFRHFGIKKKPWIEIDAPKLSHLALENHSSSKSVAATIVAPMLTELIWHHSYNSVLNLV